MKVFLRILSFGRPYHSTVPQYVIYTLLHTLFSVVNITILIPIFQILFEEKTLAINVNPEFQFSISYFQDLFYFYFGNVINSEGRLGALYFVTGVVVFSFLFSNVFGILSALLTSKVRIRVISNLRNAAFEKVSRFDLSYFTTNKNGDLTSRITTDIQPIDATVAGTLKE